MKKVLVFAAISEAITGLALLIVPSTRGRCGTKLGRHYIIDKSNNPITCQFVDLEKLGRELGVLREYERVVT